MLTIVKLPNCLTIKIISLLSLTDSNRFLELNRQMSQLRKRAEIWRDKILQTWPQFWHKSLDCENVEQMYKRLRQDHKLPYPFEVIELFVNNGYHLSELPILDLGLKIGSTEYIDFVEPEEMTAKIMRFTDRIGRIGIIFRIRGLSDGYAYIGYKFKISDICTTLALFKRYAYTEDSIWSLGWGGSMHRLLNMFIMNITSENIWATVLFGRAKNARLLELDPPFWVVFLSTFYKIS